MNTQSTRLLTSGCSFTDYCWPTWSDYLGIHFQEYMNCGQAGSDNANIARNIISNSKSGDVVLIMWSGWNRHVMWNVDGFPTPKNHHNNWQYNYKRWDKNWLVNFYNPGERLFSSMDYIKMVDLDSRAKGYIAYHFSAFPWQLGEIEKNSIKDFEQIFDQYQIQNNFLLDISLEEYQTIHNFNQPVKNQYNQADRHPTPLCQYQYLMNVINPRLKLNFELDIHKYVMFHEQQVRHGNTIDDKSKKGLLNDKSLS